MPAEARLPDEVKKVIVRIRGRERIITPIENTWDNFFLNGPAVSDDFMNERGVQKPVEREACNAQVFARYQHCYLCT